MNAADVDDLLRRTAPEPAAALARLERAARHAVASSKRPGILAHGRRSRRRAAPTPSAGPLPRASITRRLHAEGQRARSPGMAKAQRSRLGRTCDPGDGRTIRVRRRQRAGPISASGSSQPPGTRRLRSLRPCMPRTCCPAPTPRSARSSVRMSARRNPKQASGRSRTLPRRGPRKTRPPEWRIPLGFAVDEIIRVIPALQEIDPLTTELVRLLGARRHQCRVCQSVRSRSAFAAGGNDALFDAVEDFESASFAADQQAALAFADGFLASPARFEPDRVSALRRHFNRAAQIELVLDLTRNATNKVAVALGGDAPRVENGYEIYEVQADGEIVYGLEAP